MDVEAIYTCSWIWRCLLADVDFALSGPRISFCTDIRCSPRTRGGVGLLPGAAHNVRRQWSSLHEFDTVNSRYEPALHPLQRAPIGGHHVQLIHIDFFLLHAHFTSVDFASFQQLSLGSLFNFSPFRTGATPAASPPSRKQSAAERTRLYRINRVRGIGSRSVG